MRWHIDGKVDATLPAQDAAGHACLTALDADPDRGRSLAGWPWMQDARAALSQPPKNAA